MRRGEREITDISAIQQVLHEALYCNVALCDADRPYVVPVSFGYEAAAAGGMDVPSIRLAGVSPVGSGPSQGLGWLYFHCAGEGRTLELLARNPSVSFSVVSTAQIVTGPTACQFSCRYRSVLGGGVAAIVQDEAQRRHGLDCIMRHYGFPGTADYDPKALAKTTVVAIKIEALTGKANT